MSLGFSKSIYYFSAEGKQNLNKTIDLVAKRAIQDDIKHIIVFTADGDGAFGIKAKLKKYPDITVHAATFPYKQVFRIRDSEGDTKNTVAGTSLPEIRKKLESARINLIQGVMPLQEIIIPNTKDIKTQTILYTLSLISGGLRLCIQAILMATDGGHIEPGEHVIAMSADTAIVARSSLSTWLFHPSEGLEIMEIICKPSRFTITHSPEKE